MNQKRRRLSKKKITRFVLWLLVAASLLLLVSACFMQKPVGESSSQESQLSSLEESSKEDASSQESSEEPSSQPEESSEPEPVIPEPSVVRFKAVGDNLIHSSIYNQAYARTGGNGYDYTYAYENIADLVGSADISSINQESIIAPIYEPSTYPQFNATPELGDLMLELGFDVFCLANNHCLDKYEDGILSSLDYWAERPQAITCGVYRNEEDFQNIRTKTVDDITFSFIGLTELTNGLSLPEGSDVVILLGAMEDKIKEQIEKADAISDVVVVNVHWGNEYTHIPTDRQEYLAQKMVEWGADVILGHHPHVLQPITYLDKPDGGKALVCYSLGNFMSAQDQGVRLIGGLVDFDVTKDYEKNTVEITRCEFVPIITHYDWGFANNRLYAFPDYTAELANNHGVRAYTPDFSLDYIKGVVTSVIDEEFLAESAGID